MIFQADSKLFLFLIIFQTLCFAFQFLEIICISDFGYFLVSFYCVYHNSQFLDLFPQTLFLNISFQSGVARDEKDSINCCRLLSKGSSAFFLEFKALTSSNTPSIFPSLSFNGMVKKETDAYPLRSSKSFVSEKSNSSSLETLIFLCPFLWSTLIGFFFHFHYSFRMCIHIKTMPFGVANQGDPLSFGQLN